MNVPVADDDSNVSRAREILDTLKERREFLSDAIDHCKTGPEEKLPSSSGAVVKPVPKKLSLLFTVEESEAITRQLNESVNERRGKLSRMSRGSPDNDDTLKKMHEARTTMVSPTKSVRSRASMGTTSTTDSTGDLMSTPDTSASSGHCENELVMSIPQPPTLKDIAEAFASTADEVAPKGEGSSYESDSSSASSSSDESSTASSEVDRVPHMMPTGLRLISSFDESSARPQGAPDTLPSIVTASSFDSSMQDMKQPSKLLSLSDLELPPELSPVIRYGMRSDTSASNSASASRSNTPLSSTSTLSTKEERALYIGNLYSPSKRMRSPGLRRDVGLPRRERSQVNRAMMADAAVRRSSMRNSMNGSPALSQEILGISLVQDHDQRRELLRSLHQDVGHLSREYERVVPTSPLTLSQNDLVLISDESSFECTTDSDTSGWLSSSESNRANSLIYNTDDDTLTDGEGGSLLSGVHPLVGDESEVEEELLEPILFVSEETADALCKANGGLYAMALSSGMSDETPLKFKVAPVNKRATTFLRLSTDFRCGTFGSLYDIAIRSGCKLDAPLPPKPQPAKPEIQREKFVRTRGGWYDMARRSGLTDKAIRSRKAYSITTKTRGRAFKDDSFGLSEEVTDNECGARGSLYLALESGALYASGGSFYFMTDLSGPRFQ